MYTRHGKVWHDSNGLKNPINKHPFTFPGLSCVKSALSSPSSRKTGRRVPNIIIKVKFNYMQNYLWENDENSSKYEPKCCHKSGRWHDGVSPHHHQLTLVYLSAFESYWTRTTINRHSVTELFHFSASLLLLLSAKLRSPNKKSQCMYK